MSGGKQNSMAKRRTLIWLIDGDAQIRLHLQRLLLAEAFDVRSFPHGRDAERRLARERPDLILLERLLEDEDGLELCRRIREHGDDVPIIALSAQCDVEDRIIGFDTGVDDYIAKPFVDRELIARMRAVLRRRSALPSGAPLAEAAAVHFGECRLELVTRALFRGERNIELTSGEFAILTALVRNAHRSLTRERLLELARGPGNAGSGRSIDVQISRLRRLIETDPAKPRHIQTVWGYGYVFVPSTGA